MIQLIMSFIPIAERVAERPALPTAHFKAALSPGESIVITMDQPYDNTASATSHTYDHIYGSPTTAQIYFNVSAQLTTLEEERMPIIRHSLILLWLLGSSFFFCSCVKAKAPLAANAGGAANRRILSSRAAVLAGLVVAEMSLPNCFRSLALAWALLSCLSAGAPYRFQGR